MQKVNDNRPQVDEMHGSLFGEPVRGPVLLAVADRWSGELEAMLPQAVTHAGDVHFTTSSDGPGLRPGSIDLLVVDPAVARLEALRPALARGAALAVVAADGVVHGGRDTRTPTPLGRLTGGRR